MSSEDFAGITSALGQNQSTAPTNGVLVGGVYNSTPQTFTNGQFADLQVNSNGYLIVSLGGSVGTLNTQDAADGPVTPGAVGSKSILIGVQFNTALPTLTNTQMAAIQSDNHGCIIIGTGANVIGAVTQSGGPWTTADAADGPVVPGAVATKSMLMGGQFNTALPTLTNTQQAAIQLDSSGRVILGTSSAVIGAVTQSGSPWTIQGDSASGGSKAGNPVQIGGVFNTTQPTVTTGQTVEAQSTNRGAQIVATGVDSFNINNVSGAVSLPTGAATAANQLANPINSNGQYNEITNLTTAVQTFTAPAKAVGFLLEADDGNTGNVRWKIGSNPSTTSGMKLQPGRDSGYYPCGLDVRVIADSGSNQIATIQWVMQS